MGNEIAVSAAHDDLPMTAADVKAQVNRIQEIMRAVMQGPTKDNPGGVHYGIIPGTNGKPTLLKAGAEKIAMTFRLDCQVEGEEILDLGNGHQECRSKVVVYTQGSGRRLGAGVGSCSTMEGKYRFRTGPKESTGKPVPKEYWDWRKENTAKAQESIGGR